MKTGVAYCRMSTDKQEYSIDSQMRLIREYAQRNNIVLLKTYADEGISGRNVKKRQAFLEMIEDSATGSFDCVLIYDSSRFARNLEQSIVYKSILKKNGVTLISITEPSVDDDTALITDALFGAMNEMYSRKLAKNVKRGMEQTAIRGSFFSMPPLGYKREEAHKPIVIDPPNAEHIKYIFEAYLAGKSKFFICRELNNQGVKTRYGNPLECRTISYILTNPTYKGYLKWCCDGKTYYQKADHEAIIDEKTFDTVQKRYAENQSKIRRKARPPEACKHWLSGLMRCAHCNTVYVFGRGYGGREDRFRCGGYARGTCNVSASVPVSKMTAIVIAELKRILGDEKNIYQLNVKTPKLQQKVDYDAELKKCKQTLKRAKEAYLSEIDTIEEYRENKKRITNEIKRLEEEKKKSEENSKFDVKKFQKILTNAVQVLESDVDYMQKQSIARALIEKIVIDGYAHTMQFYFFA